VTGFRTNSSGLSVVQWLLIINGGLFLMEMYSAGFLINTFALWPVGLSEISLSGQTPPHFQIWQLVSYSFLHGGLTHILLNMYALWLFGSRLEHAWGSKIFAFYYFVCVIGAGLVQLFVVSNNVQADEIYPTLGASGGVFGLLLAFGMTYPNERLMLIFPPIVLKAKWFVFIYGVIELWAGIADSQAGVAHFAHLGGMVFGFGLLWYWRKYPPSRY